MQRGNMKLADFGEETWSDDDFVNTLQTFKFSRIFVVESKLFLLVLSISEKILYSFIARLLLWIFLLLN